MNRAAPDPRLAAHRILLDVEDGAYTDRAAALHASPLPRRERALARELAYGSIRLRARLDVELAHLLDRPLDRVEPSLRQWLRLGLYQLRETRVPPHAAVNETVARARARAGRRAAGLVNAVLRASQRLEDRSTLYPALERDPIGHLTTFGSHPEWLVRRWLDRWPLDRVTSLVEANNRPRPTVVRLLDPDGPAEASLRAGEAFTLLPLEAWPRSCVLARGAPGGLLARLAAVVQDPAASAVVDYAGPSVESPVLDICAAPGGKTSVLAWTHPGAGPFVAADVSPERLRDVEQAATRLGLDVGCVVADGRKPAFARARTVLLDAPCTGTGVLGRRPDARWRLTQRRLDSLTRLQSALLDASAELVETGGRLIYSTCSLEPEENELQVASFIERNAGFELERPGDLSVPSGVIGKGGELRVLPWLYDTDGAYAVRLRRRRA